MINGMSFFRKKKSFITGSYSLQGRRDYQEDNFLVKQKNDIYLLFVADGLGGATNSELASAMCVQIFEKEMDENPGKLVVETEAFLKNIIFQISGNLYNFSITDKRYSRAMTTLCGFVVVNDVFYVFHVGDSRVYRYVSHEDNLVQLTKDQTYVQNLVNNGVLTQEEAENHPRKNMLTSCISVNINDIKIEIEKHEFQKGDVLLACTDGLSSLDYEEIKSLIKKNASSDSLSEMLVKQAYKAGSTDNITACTLYI